jgi:hypothetical protein
VRLFAHSACIGWLERVAEEGGLLAERALFALAGEGRIAELGGIEGGARLDHGVEDTRQFVGGGGDGPGRTEFRAHAPEEVAQRRFAPN